MQKPGANRAFLFDRNRVGFVLTKSCRARNRVILPMPIVYEPVEYKLDDERLTEVKKRPGWECICENQYGYCEWNKYTGELLWFASDENKVYYQRKTHDG